MAKKAMMIGLVLGLVSLQAQAALTFLAHYDTTTNADFAAGNAADIGGSPPKGSIVTGGEFAGAANFSGVQCSQYSTAGNIQAASGTLVFWYKADSSTNTDYSNLFSIGTSEMWAPTTDLVIQVFPAWSVTNITVQDTANHSYTLSLGGFGGNAWNNLALTWNTSGGTGDFNVYVNGSLSKSETGVAWNGFSFDSTMLVGHYSTSWYPNGANGSIDDLAIFDTALSGTQIGAIYSSGQPVPEPASLVLLVVGVLGFIKRTK